MGVESIEGGHSSGIEDGMVEVGRGRVQLGPKKSLVEVREEGGHWEPVPRAKERKRTGAESRVSRGPRRRGLVGLWGRGRPALLTGRWDRALSAGARRCWIVC